MSPRLTAVTRSSLYSQIGKRIPLYCSAMGKAILADQSDVEVEAYLTENQLPKITKNTITTTEGFFQEIDRVRELGYAFDNGEHEEEVFCVGASLTRDGKNFGAISVSIPKIQAYRFISRYNHQSGPTV